ncbi:MAG: hypothetical protein R2729_32035 [Bryobacteraceae bacterium]
MGPVDILGIISRWTHIASIAVLTGGCLHAWLAAREGGSGVPGPWPRAVRMAVVLAVLSGIRNLLAKGATPPGYHAIFGVKMLLALHVLAVAIVASKPEMDGAKRTRLLGGVAASAFVTILISAYLRWLSQ